MKTTFHCLFSFTFVTFLIHWPGSPVGSCVYSVDTVFVDNHLHMKCTVKLVPLCMYNVWFAVVWWQSHMKEVLVVSLHSFTLFWWFETPMDYKPFYYLKLLYFIVGESNILFKVNCAYILCTYQCELQWTPRSTHEILLETRSTLLWFFTVSVPSHVYHF